MNRRAALALSFGLNLLLAGAVVWAAKSREARVIGPSIAEPITNRIVRTRLVTNEAAPAVIEVAAPFNWAQVESTDYRVYVANLRAIGCPEATIHDIVEADVNDLFSDRVRQLVDGVTGYFWNYMVDREKVEALLKDKVEELESIDKQRDETMRELFAEDDPNSKVAREKQRAGQLESLTWQFDFLPAEKVAQIQNAYGRMQTAWSEVLKTNASPQDQQREYKELSARQDREILALLTPEEYEEYKLRTTDAAGVRYRLSNLDVTEDEVRAIALAKMKSQGDGAIQQVLGPDRFADYRRGNDNAYQQTLRVTDRFDLPAETANQVYQMQKDAQARARAIRDDRNRTVEERRQVLQAMQAETKQTIAAALGPEVFKAYQKYSGDWLTKFADGVK